MTKFLAWVLGIEVLVAGAAPVIFTTIENRLVAGMVAGAVFTALGVFIFVVGLQVRRFRGMPTFWMGCWHLFLSSIPLLVTRLLNAQGSFEDTRILGMPGPVFHNYSTAVYFIMMAATAFDLVRSRRAAIN